MDTFSPIHTFYQIESAGNAEANSKRSTFKIMTYNVWFREDLEVHRRMEALGDLVQQHKPHLICFQVRALNYDLIPSPV